MPRARQKNRKRIRPMRQRRRQSRSRGWRRRAHRRYPYYVPVRGLYPQVVTNMCVPHPLTEGGLFTAATNLAIDQPNYGHCDVKQCQPQMGIGDRLLFDQGRHPGYVVGSCNVASFGAPGRCVATSNCEGMCVYGGDASSLAGVLSDPSIVAGCGDVPYGTCCARSRGL